MDRIDQSDRNGGGVDWLRRCLFWVLILGLVGTEAELLLMEHYENPLQFTPLLLIALAFVVLLWHRKSPASASRRSLTILMWLFVIAGFVGVALHIRGAVLYQLELDPDIARWELLKKAMRAKAPPVLAPGVMLQFGLIGLAYLFSDSQNKGPV